VVPEAAAGSGEAQGGRFWPRAGRRRAPLARLQATGPDPDFGGSEKGPSGDQTRRRAGRPLDAVVISGYAARKNAGRGNISARLYTPPADVSAKAESFCCWCWCWCWCCWWSNPARTGVGRRPGDRRPANKAGRRAADRQIAGRGKDDSRLPSGRLKSHLATRENAARRLGRRVEK
jgi:hypothetical protein